MNDQQFQALMSYVMATDPDPNDFIVTSGDDAIVQSLLDEEAVKRGFDSWYVAYHEFVPKKSFTPSNHGNNSGNVECDECGRNDVVGCIGGTHYYCTRHEDKVAEMHAESFDT
jgi:hypothetical protein